VLCYQAPCLRCFGTTVASRPIFLQVQGVLRTRKLADAKVQSGGVLYRIINHVYHIIIIWNNNHILFLFFFFFFYNPGDPDQFACTMTIPRIYWTSYKSSRHVKHRRDDRRAHEGSNSGRVARQALPVDHWARPSSAYNDHTSIS